MLQSMGLQRDGHDLATEQQLNESSYVPMKLYKSRFWTGFGPGVVVC